MTAIEQAYMAGAAAAMRAVARILRKAAAEAETIGRSGFRDRELAAALDGVADDTEKEGDGDAGKAVG